ncbi:MAG: glycosyl hydrolase family 18 protein [bacterium]|nr:glycosyl hydrolase family 18 protein [bacterium]
MPHHIPLTLLSLALVTLTPALASAAKQAPFEVTGWLPYWRAATSTADVLPHLSSFTSVMPFGYIVRSDGTLEDAFNLGSTTAGATLALRTAAKRAHVKIIPTVMWSNGAAIHAILSNQKSRIALEDRITALVKDNGFDGIDIDFEGKKAETKPYFSTFLKGLYQRMGTKWVYCAIESRTPVADRYEGTPPPDATEYANDYVAINKYCDRVEIMAYDQQTIDVTLNKAADGTPYIPISDTKWAEKVLKVAAKTISKKKLVLGVATYGYEWQVTPLSESGFRYDMQWAFNPRYATDLSTALNITPTRNAAGEMSFTYVPSAASASAGGAVPPDTTNGNGLLAATTHYSDGTTTPVSGTPYNILWWSDARAIADKITLAKKLGLRGVAIFKLDGGEDQGLWAGLPKR